MLRELLSVICSVEVLAPEALIRMAERRALKNPDGCRWRSWVTPGARLEGLGFLVAMWRSEESYAAFKQFLGLIGLLAFLYPHRYVGYGARFAYTADSNPQWKPWVYTGPRVVGLIYLLIALDELRSSGSATVSQLHPLFTISDLSILLG